MQTKTTKLRPCKPEELCTWTQRQDVVPRDEKTVVSQMKNMPVCALTQNITPKPQVPSAFPVSFSYSSFNLGCGNKEHVYITHISDEWEIYCQLDKNSEIIEELETKISEEEEKLHGADATAPVDGMCLAKYIDGRWYRGLANPVQSSLYLNVFFVDYGNTSIVVAKHSFYFSALTLILSLSRKWQYKNECQTLTVIIFFRLLSPSVYSTCVLCSKTGREPGWFK
jgi:hypothetical protein